MGDMTSNPSKITKGWQGPTQVAATHVVLYVAITLAIGHTVRIDWLALPAVALWALTAVLEWRRLTERRAIFLSIEALALAFGVVSAVLS